MQHTSTEPKSARRVSDPHSFEVTNPWGDRFHRAAPERSTIADCNQKRSKGWTKIVVIGGDAQRRIEAMLKAKVDLREILIHAPASLRRGRIDTLDSQDSARFHFMRE